MGWFSFSSSNKESSVSTVSPPSQQIEQRSHQSLNLPQGSDIATTLNQLSSQTGNDQEVKVKEIDNIQDKNEIEKTVENFVESYPISNMFVIDGEKDSKQSIICTTTDNGKTCLKLKMNSIQLFKIMQKQEYFCSLPDDINATYFECRKIK